MKTEKDAKAKLMKVVIIACVVIALVMVLVFLLKGEQSNLPTQGDGTTQTDTSDTDSENKDTPNPNVKVYTVTFKDYDGTVLETQKVEKGKAATAPTEPKREHFEFSGWDKPFDKVSADLVVTATYTTTKTVIYADHISVKKGTNTVTMKIRILNNPGIMGAVLKVSVDDKVFTFAEGKKSGYPGLTLTSSGSDTKSSPYTFMLDALELTNDDKKDGTLFTITFKVKDTAAVGKYDVVLSYDKGAIFDDDYDDPKVVLENGTITIK